MAEAINQRSKYGLGQRQSSAATHGPRIRHGEASQPNYALRRIVAVGMLGLAAFGTKAVVADTLDRFNGTDIPSVNEAHEHPENYGVYVVKEGDTRDGIAIKFTSENHDYRNNSSQLKEQMDAAGDPVLSPGDTLIVPTTLPEETPENQHQVGNG